MNGIQVDDIFLGSILKDAFGVEGKTEDKAAVEAQKLEEAKKAKEATEKKEEVKEEIEHSCPLCESKLEAPISDERLAEHVQYIMGVINEAFETEGEELVEETKDEAESTEE